MIRFLCVSAFVILFLVFSIPLLIIEEVIGKFNPDLKSRSSQAIIKWAFGVCVLLSGARVDFTGTENIPKEGAFLYVSNHRSYFDIVLTYASRVPRAMSQSWR